MVRKMVDYNCRSLCGERGLKYVLLRMRNNTKCRSLCGERGLKFLQFALHDKKGSSLPMWGVWIEINKQIEQLPIRIVAPHAVSVD